MLHQPAYDGGRVGANLRCEPPRLGQHDRTLGP